MKHTMKRASQVLEIAKRMASKLDSERKDFSYSNRLEEIQLFSHYCEKGYHDPDSGVIAVGNWNPIRSDEPILEYPKDLILRVERALDRLGVELEWVDEWSSCDDCNGLFRTQSDSYDWKPSFTVDLKKGEKLCQHCALTCDCYP